MKGKLCFTTTSRDYWCNIKSDILQTGSQQSMDKTTTKLLHQLCTQSHSKPSSTLAPLRAGLSTRLMSRPLFSMGSCLKMRQYIWSSLRDLLMRVTLQMNGYGSYKRDSMGWNKLDTFGTKSCTPEWLSLDSHNTPVILALMFERTKMVSYSQESMLTTTSSPAVMTWVSQNSKTSFTNDGQFLT